MNKNCGAVLALVVASSCGNSDDIRGENEVLKRKNEALTKRLDDIRRGVEVLKREGENSNRRLLEMKNKLAKSFDEFLLTGKCNELVGCLVDELFGSYSFSFENINGRWKLCSDYGIMDFDFRDDSWNLFIYWLLKSGKKIQGWKNFWGNNIDDLVLFLNFLGENGFLGKESVFQDNEFEEILLSSYSAFGELTVDSLMELFRICKNVKFYSGMRKVDFRADSIRKDDVGWGDNSYLFSLNEGDKFHILGEDSEDARAKFEKFCKERGFPSIVDE